MTPIATSKSDSQLLDRLASHQTLHAAPREELDWLIRHGELRRYEPGEPVVQREQPVTDMVIMLAGRIGVYIDRGTGRRHVTESVAGDVTGLLPYSRLTTPGGDVVAEEPTEVIAIHRDNFDSMIRECPVVTATLVHAMIDRARHFTSTSWQDDKMVAMGRLAAGIAHELNNPASAAMRSSQFLQQMIREAEDAAQALGQLNITEAQRTRIVALRDAELEPLSGVLSPLELSDREERLCGWLDERGIDSALAAALVEGGVDTELLDDLAASLPPQVLPVAVRWIATAYTVRSLATEVERATRQIHDLVSSMRRFTYMDRPLVSEPTSVAQGLADTVAVLATKARSRSAEVKLEISPTLPLVPGRAGELNQVWSNLIENALDAVDAGGQVTVRADLLNDQVTVRILDNGPGIPADIQHRIFDPFFTTKRIGEGSGLGLDIARRIVRSHSGQIAVESRPGRTEFSVMLPVS